MELARLGVGFLAGYGASELTYRAQSLVVQLAHLNHGLPMLQGTVTLNSGQWFDGSYTVFRFGIGEVVGSALFFLVLWALEKQR